MNKKIVPGLLLALGIAVIARFIEGLLPSHIIGASVVALFIGMLIHHYWQPSPFYQEGIKFTSKRVLKLAIILLGASLNLQIVLEVGQRSFLVMIFTFLTCFGGGYFIGKSLGLNWKLSNLISAGTGICGGSAIAAIAPAIDAEDADVAYAISATFLFDIAMIVIFPLMGRVMQLSDMAYGMWAGTAVNDTSSVVAASYAFSEAAGDFATMVKLTRTLAIVPTVVVFALLYIHLERKKGHHLDHAPKLSLGSTMPWFILGFLILTALNSFGYIPVEVSSTLKSISKFLMVAALAAIGLNTNFQKLQKSGAKPMVHGFIISLLVVIVAIAVILMSGTL